MTDSQTETIAFLEGMMTGGGRKRVETHISIILLAGDAAFKLKKPVKLPYADFSTPALRLAACENEVTLNRRTAPDLYRGTRRITRTGSGGLELDGPGELVDAAVEMRRFDEDELFDRLAERHALDTPLMEETAVAIAGFHEKAEVLHTGGGAANLRGVLDINRAGFATSHVFSDAAVAGLDATLRKRLARHAALLDARERAGKLRLCHGDLHLRNIYRTPEGPRLFDCIEFNDAIASTDILYDLAFLLMDLWHRDLPGLASAVVNRYLDRSADDAGFCLLPFMMAVRAEVRAHVTATQAETAKDGGEALKALAGQYFELANDLLNEQEPRLIAIGGLSGSGKSTLAVRLAPLLGVAPGARLLESDRIRKALFGAGLSERLPDEAYAPGVSEKVYAALNDRARTILDGGGIAIVDAVFSRAEEREAVSAVAAGLGAPFTGLWLDAAPDVLRQRIRARSQGDSDATTEVLESQLARDPGPLDWTRLDATADAETLTATALDMIGGGQPTSM
ncbi:AAA family ATPase [Rhizobiaceae bacterium BDR2-2]|uniref:AAA family ATPase n=1 Tax=Ectorhizobium quercum TaxID=2965071 RepID=A0AAE3N4M2_9HYPH|nr:bifunctional aminoglycoside phosphotransferase/ATP-binding protein [Ectorhizobium quercum]MCX8999599.1 AAA family ATPase [Ectorhizobium quercum]